MSQDYTLIYFDSLEYTIYHQVGPHMSAPNFLRNSPISDAAGWVDVDKNTLQSKKYSNVFGLGDCTNTPNSKTAAAVTSQAPVVVHNIERSIDKLPLDGNYPGYASCPLVIARNKVMLAEFGYGGKLAETFGPDGKFPHKLLGTDGEIPYRFFFFLKETIFPYVYWNLWTKVSNEVSPLIRTNYLNNALKIYFCCCLFSYTGMVVRNQWTNEARC